jgi:hypothetical protein
MERVFIFVLNDSGWAGAKGGAIDDLIQDIMCRAGPVGSMSMRAAFTRKSLTMKIHALSNNTSLLDTYLTWRAEMILVVLIIFLNDHLSIKICESTA